MPGIIAVCNRILEYSFYALFFSVPLAFSGVNYELFEFNKMWLTYGLTIVIGTAWFLRMIGEKELKIQRTPLDIPLILFFFSQLVSTLFSLDTHVSFWGYYSRFNGGLLSTIAYLFLYYAFVTNFPKEKIQRLLHVILAGGAVVALWGLPSHFGYDPTCLLFRGTLDVSCWTEAFQPKVRIFSTLGQPNWLAAYLAVLIPLSIVMGIKSLETLNKSQREAGSSNLEVGFLKKKSLPSILYLLLSILFFFDLLYTKSQSGFLGLIGGLIIFFLLFRMSPLKNKARDIYIKQKKFLYFLLIFFVAASFFIEHPVTLFNLQKYTTYSGIKNLMLPSGTIRQTQAFAGELGGTDSFAIRKLVWIGAVDIWKANPLFGSGVETFAFAYYKYRPPAHNLTSEWDYLYNKAHNEYLNYLATTGTFGLGTYLLFIGWFLFPTFAKITNLFANFAKKFASLRTIQSDKQNQLLTVGLLSGFVSILITNFVGFSVVVTSLFFFLIPAALNVLENRTKKTHLPASIAFPFYPSKKRSYLQAIWLALIGLTAAWLLYTLIAYWIADKAYGNGYNLNRAGEYQGAFSSLSSAVSLRRNEPVFLDELSYTTAVLSVALSSQNESTASAQFAKEAVRLSDIVLTNHPNNIVFWKTRVRLLYALSQIDEKYTPVALSAIEKASLLAPSDAKIFYNLSLIHGQAGDRKKAIETIKKTINLKPDYIDAYFALALFYRDGAVDINDRVINPDMQKKAVETLNYILSSLDPNDESAKKTLRQWGEKL